LNLFARQYTECFRTPHRILSGTTASMADTFDPYREALVVEAETVWPADDTHDPRERYHIEALLHAHPEQAAHLEYTRVHTGFARRIHVTDEDLARVMPHVS
jgi:hypothetical protein